MGQELETCRVFVVDDEAIIATTLAVILRHEGFETDSFTSPQDALKAARDDAPDLLVADLSYLVAHETDQIV
jgi:two-component system NtrC family response regulator